MTTLDLLPERVYMPATYVSQEFPILFGATSIAVVLSGRDTWGRLGFEQIVISYTLEKNIRGEWEHVAGSHMYRGTVYDEDTNAQSTEARMNLLLPERMIPYPYYRVIVTCYSACLCHCTVMFE